MGCGKNGTFDKNPDWQQWGILAVHNTAMEKTFTSNELIQQLYGGFLKSWVKWFKCETWTIFLEPVEGHGKWDGKEPFGQVPKQTEYNGIIATMTRATIRLNKLNAFWKNVGGVAHEMGAAKGLLTSIGIGEMPYIKQATFSVWQSKEAMKQFAYQMHQHTAVIRKTRQENWYSEDMFMRFKPTKTFGSIKGSNPLAGIL